ncbi:MAG: hypothetical protein Q8O19_00945 [Rectinemataceae bacterium]|nr:hypothetical protein [Rectinemataceae bacterium]
MIQVPVICHNCEAFFGANILDGAILGNTRLGNNPIPCPFCGKMGYTIEGLYSSIGQTVQIIANSLNSEKSLALLVQNLKQFKTRELDPRLFKKEIQQNVPELKKITDTLPKTRSELYAFVAVLLSAIALLISAITQSSSSSQSMTKEDVKEIVMVAISKTISEERLLKKIEKVPE